MNCPNETTTRVIDHRLRATFVFVVSIFLGCSSNQTSEALQKYCDIAKSALPMGTRAGLSEAEVWTEWEKTDPGEEAIATMRSFFDHITTRQSEVGTEHLTPDDFRTSMSQVTSDRGITPPSCDEVWAERPARWVFEQSITQLGDFCRRYRLTAQEASATGGSTDTHEERLSATLADWRGKKHPSSRTQAFIAVLSSKTPELRGETFAADLKSFLQGREREAIMCSELQDDVEALYKQSKGQPTGE